MARDVHRPAQPRLGRLVLAVVQSTGDLQGVGEVPDPGLGLRVKNVDQGSILARRPSYLGDAHPHLGLVRHLPLYLLCQGNVPEDDNITRRDVTTSFSPLAWNLGSRDHYEPNIRS